MPSGLNDQNKQQTTKKKAKIIFQTVYGSQLQNHFAFSKLRFLHHVLLLSSSLSILFVGYHNLVVASYGQYFLSRPRSY